MATLYISALSDCRSSLFLFFTCEELSPILLRTLGSLFSFARRVDVNRVPIVQRLMMRKGLMTFMIQRGAKHAWSKVTRINF